MAIKSGLRASGVRLQQKHPAAETGVAEARRPKAEARSSEFFNRDLVIGVDAHLAGNLHGFLGDLARAELRVLRQRLCGRLRVWTSAANGGNAAVGLDHIALPAEQKRLLLVADDEQRLQMAQKLVGTPVFR